MQIRQGHVEETRAVDIRYLKQHGLLEAGSSGTLRWSIDGEETGSIRLRVDDDHLVLNYRWRN